MKKLCLVLVLLVLASAGCGVGKPDECVNGYAFDPAFTEHEKEIIISAGHQWNALIGREAFTFNGSVNSSVCGINKVTTNEVYEAIRADDEGKHFAGKNFGRTRAIYIDMRKSLKDITLKNIALHEFGHELNLDHVSSGVMYRSVNNMVEFSAFDIAECERVSACRVGAGNRYE